MLVDIEKDKNPKRVWMTLLTPGLEEFGRIQGVIKDSLEIEQGTKQHDVLRFSLSRVMYTDNTTPYLMWGREWDKTFGYKKLMSDRKTLINPYFNYCEGDYIIELCNGYDYKTADKSYYIIQEPKTVADDTDIKEIEALSMTKELSRKKLRNYRSEVADVITPKTLRTILSEVLNDKMGGRWRIGDIDPDVETRYRSYDVTDQTVWDFFLDLQESFRCVFKFETIYDREKHKMYSVINAYDLTAYPLCPVCGSDQLAYEEGWLECQNPECGSTWHKGQVIKITISGGEQPAKSETLILEEDGNSVYAGIIEDWASGDYTDILVTVDDTVLLQDTNYTIDTEKKTINLVRTPWRKQIYGADSGLYITDKNYIKKFEEKADHSNIVTRYYIYGKDNLPIRDVNPTGQDYIDDLGFYRGFKDEDGWHSKYMSKELLDELEAYDEQMEGYQTAFQKLLKERVTLQEKMSHATVVSTTQRDFLDVLDQYLDETKDIMEDELSLNKAIQEAMESEDKTLEWDGTTYDLNKNEDKDALDKILKTYYNNLRCELKKTNCKLSEIYNIDITNPDIDLSNYSMGSLQEALAVIQARIDAVTEYNNSSDRPNSHPDIGTQESWKRGTKLYFEAGGEDVNKPGTATVTLTSDLPHVTIPWDQLYNSAQPETGKTLPPINEWKESLFANFDDGGTDDDTDDCTDADTDDDTIEIDFYVSTIRDDESMDMLIIGKNYSFYPSPSASSSVVPTEIHYMGTNLYVYQENIEYLIERKQKEIDDIQEELDANQKEIDELRQKVEFMGNNRSEDTDVAYPNYTADYTDIASCDTIDTSVWLDADNEVQTEAFEKDKATLMTEGISEEHIDDYLAYLQYRNEILFEYNYYVREDTYTNNDIGAAEDATDEQYTKVQEQLLADGKKAFESVKSPSIALTIDVVDFEHIIGRAYDRDKMHLGDVVHVRHGAASRYEYVLRIIKIVYKPDSNSLTLTFSNAENYKTPGLFVDSMFQAGISSASAISVKGTSWDNAPSTAVDRMQNEILAKGKALIATTDNAVIIDGKGITVEGEFEANKGSQIRITKNCIALVRNDGQTIDTAILPDGIVAKTIVGDLILGKSLRISFPKQDERGETTVMNFYTDESGVNISNGALSIFSGEDKNNGVTLDPSEGLVITAENEDGRKLQAVFNSDGIEFTEDGKVSLSYTTDKKELLVNGDIRCKHLYLGNDEKDILTYINKNGETNKGDSDQPAIDGGYISCTGLRIAGDNGRFEVDADGCVVMENSDITLNGANGTITINPNDGIVMESNNMRVVDLDINTGEGTFSGTIETEKYCIVGQFLQVGCTRDDKGHYTWSGKGQIQFGNSAIIANGSNLNITPLGTLYIPTNTRTGENNGDRVATQEWVENLVQDYFSRIN
mgnify:CR=1 FL=1